MESETLTNESSSKSIDPNINPLTKQDVEIVIKRSLGQNFNIIDYYLKTYSDEKLGFMGAHRNLVVKVSQDGTAEKEIHTYFLKSMPYNVDGQANSVEESRMFQKETSFYSLIMPELMKSSKDNSWAAQCFLVKKDTLVFENLKIKNYTLRDKFLDVASLKAALSSVAKMHAASLLTEKRLGKTFIEMYPHLFDEILFSREGPFATWYQSGIDVITKVAEKLELPYKIVPKACNLILDKILPSKTRRNVLCHGDAWSNNLMFNDSNCALVDFQLIRYAPAMTDVSLLIYHNARKELRQKCEMDLLKHYYEILCIMLRDGGLDVPSFDDVLEEYEEMRIVAIVTVNMYYQMNKIDKKKHGLESPEAFKILHFGNRMPLVFKIMEKDERYKELIESTVSELIEVSSNYNFE